MTEEQRLERKAKRFWVTLVVFLLGLQVVIGFVSIRLATGDQSVAIVPDYHRAALKWDQTRSELRASERFGWTVKVIPSDVVDGNGMRALTLTVRDQNGTAVEDLDVTCDVYHHARGNDVKQFELKYAPGQGYVALTPIGKAGLWQVEFTCQHDGELVRIQRTLEL